MRRRRKKTEEHENLERWLVSYADFITLLFTFFAALYALSSMDKAKADKFSGSLRQAFQVIEEPIVIHEDRTNALVEDIRRTIKDVPGISAKAEPRGIVITFEDEVLFSSGSAELKAEATPILERLPKVLNDAPGKIAVEGHTDNVPVSSRKYASNWELSTARAVTVLDFFINKGLDPNRFSVAGYSEFRPLQSNNTPEGRSKNRRVEMVLAQ